jgi:phospholipid/cholesterol/gamma-HCH transport system ATP-binding protein
MFQDGALFSSLTVRENVEAPMREKLGIDAATRSALADLRIAMVGLPAKAGDLSPSDLSGGMRKRAGLAARWRWTRRSCSSTNRPPASTRSARPSSTP